MWQMYLERLPHLQDNRSGKEREKEQKPDKKTDAKYDIFEEIISIGMALEEDLEQTTSNESSGVSRVADGNNDSKQPVSSSANDYNPAAWSTSSLLGLNRIHMEEERLARATQNMMVKEVQHNTQHGVYSTTAEASKLGHSQKTLSSLLRICNVLLFCSSLT